MTEPSTPIPPLVRILLAEKDPSTARRIARHLEASGDAYEISRATTLQGATESLELHLPDLCLLDLALLDSGGDETARRFRAAARRVPVVVLSESEDERAKTAALRKGVNGWLVKDELTPRLLARTIHDVLELQQTYGERRKAQEMWSKLFMASPIALAVSEARTSRMIEVNDAFEEMFGQEREEILGRSALELGYWESPERRQELIARVESADGFQGEEAWFRDARGRRGRMFLGCRRLGLSGQDHLLWTIQDITARREGERWRHLLESSVEAAAHGIVITDRQGDIVWTNPAFTEMTGYSKDEVLGRNPRVLKSGEQDEAFYDDLWSTILEGKTWHGEIVNRRKDGSRYTERQSVVPVRHGGGEISHFIAIKEDISGQKARREQLEETVRHLNGLLDTAAGLIFRVRLPDMELTYVTPNVGEVTGFPVERWTEEPAFWKTRIPEEDLQRIFGTIQGAIEARESRAEEEYRLRHADGSLRWYRSVARFELDEAGQPTAFVGTSIDVTERRELEERLRHLALHDPLTDLANRTLLADRLDQAMARVERHSEGLALLMLDLRRFKQVNTTLGHTAGDRVLVEVARRLESAVRGEDTVVRMGGDEFLLVLTGLRDRQGLTATLDRLVSQLGRPIRVMGRDVTVDVAIGGLIVGLPGDPDAMHAGRGEDLIRYADRALQNAATRSGTSFQLYRPAVYGRDSADPLAREQDLRRGLEAGEFEPFFQHIMSLESGKVWGVEALARWRHPVRGLLGPGEFIGLAEETGLIDELGRHIMLRSCRQLGSWVRGAGLRLMVNVSARQFDHEGFIGWVEEGLESAFLAPERLQLEVTESAIMRAGHQIDDLRALGVGVVVDDFGTGYSSLLYLRDLPVQGFKIDMSFIQGLSRGRANRAIVEMTLTLGRALDLLVIAEGIETEPHLLMLRQMGCLLGQGYIFSRPVTGEQLAGTLDAKGRIRSVRTPGGHSAV